jgi:transcriptional regulator with XRE-family HTH domain
MTGDDQEGERLMTHIGKRLRTLREKSGVSRVEAARSIGLSDQAYLNREAGTTETKVFEVVILAGLFGIEPAAIFDGAETAWQSLPYEGGVSGPYEGGVAGRLADEAEEFLRCLARIGDPEIRLSIAEAIRALARAHEGDT